MSLSYHDSGVCSTAELQTFTRQARRQDDDILAFFRAHPGEDFSPSQVWGHFQQWPPVFFSRLSRSRFID